MKNTKVLNFKLWLLTFIFVFLAFTVFGCNGLLPRTVKHLDTGSVNNLKPEAIRIILQGLSDDDPLIRANAVEVVAATQRIDLMPKVQRLLKDEFVPVKFAATLAIGDLEYTLAEKLVKQSLKDPDENIRIAASYTTAKLVSANSFELLHKAMASRDQTVRANAALLLGKSGDKSALKLLYWAMKDKDSDDKVTFQAAEAIARLGDERIYPQLWTMLISAYADDRVMGIRAMGALGRAPFWDRSQNGNLTAQAKGALITMLDDDILEVRLAAAEQLGTLGDSNGEPEVLDVFTKNLTAGLDKEGLERVKVLTALAIGRIGTAALSKFLPQLLQSESKFVRIAAAKAVLECMMQN